MAKEIWKPIKGWEGLYEISNLGRVKSISRICNADKGFHKNRTLKERILKPYKTRKGYLTVGLSNNGYKKFYLVHVLIAQAFIPNPENKPFIDHINTIKDDNRIENLRWVTAHENMTNPLSIQARKDAYASGRIDKTPFRHTNRRRRGDSNLASKVVCVNPKNLQTTYYNCILDTVEDGFSAQCVSKCCRGKIGLHKGFKFYYLEDYIKLNHPTQ